MSVLFVVVGLDPELHILGRLRECHYMGHLWPWCRGVGYCTSGSSQANFDVCGLIWDRCLLSDGVT